MKRTLVKLFLIGLVILLAACSGIPKRNWPAQEGRVLDQETQQPIEGALVVALWKGVGGYSHSMCFHVETAETDKKGIYRIPVWRNEESTAYTNNQRVDFVAYKAGYEPGDLYKDGVEYLVKFEGASGERMEILRNYGRWTSCGGDDEESLKKNHLIDRALYDEAKEVAQTRDDKRALIYFIESIERYELGNDAAYQRALKMHRELK